MDSKKSVCEFCNKSLKTLNKNGDEWLKGDKGSTRKYHKKCHKLKWDQYYRDLSR